MNVIDVTLAWDERLPVYPGDPPVVRWRYRTLENAPYEATLISCGSHTGTHVDAPRHFIPDGLDVAGLPLDVLCGPARLVDLRSENPSITASTLEGLQLAGVERLLLRTVRTDDPEQSPTRSCSFLTPDAGRYLREATSVRLVGIDTLSIETDAGPDFPVHHMLLAASPPRIIVEGLDLRAAPAGDYHLFCLPLRVPGLDACPARAILVPAGSLLPSPAEAQIGPRQ